MLKPFISRGGLLKSVLLLFCLAHAYTICAQISADHIRSKEGRPVIARKSMLISCLKSFKKDRTDKVAVEICECYLNKIDKRFTNKEYKENTKGRMIDFEALINKDATIKEQIDSCFKNSGRSILMSIENFQKENIAECISSLQKSTNKTLDPQKVKEFCYCQFELIKTKKLSDAEYHQIDNPNSLLYYEMMYKCGNPFEDSTVTNNQWNENAQKDIDGPQSDTINILSFNGMAYARIKMGSTVLFWLLDTGASDLLITKEMEEEFKIANILRPDNYLGVGEYEMANGSVDPCRKYIVDDVRIGKYQVKGIVIAVSDKAKKTILGRSLLNKFSKWILDNRSNVLILVK
jgi:hypothetical protein